MSSVKINVLANLSGSAWSALIGLAFIPLYIQLMGVEAYGLVGIFMSLQAAFAVLDLGLSQTLSRELARLSSRPENGTQMRNTARTLEIVYWGGAIVVALVICSLAYYISYHWLNPEALSRETVMHALFVIAGVIGLRWPLTLYSGGLNGLQRQLLLNSFLVIFTTLQNFGALIALMLIKPSIEVYFLWQAVAAILQVLAMRVAFWRSMPKGARNFSKDIFSEVWRFALGMTGISLFSTILTQLDKVLLSKFLDLKSFGYYVFASTAAAILFKVIGPFFNAYLPRLTQLASDGSEQKLAETYHQGCELIALLVIPITCVLALCSNPILQLWTKNPELVTSSALLFSLLVIGNAINGLMTIPYVLQLAHGWTKLALYQNIVAVTLFVPALLLATSKWGSVGAAGVWIVLNLACMVINVHVMHTRLLPGQKWRWYGSSVLLPAGIGLAVTGMMSSFFDFLGEAFLTSVSLVFIFIVCFVSVAMMLPGVRKIISKIAFR